MFIDPKVKILFFKGGDLVLKLGPSGKRRWMKPDDWANLVSTAESSGTSRTNRKAEWGDFCPVSKTECSSIESLIKQTLGLDVSLSGYVHHADEDVVRKILRDHGNAELEALHGQLPVTVSDLKTLPEWIQQGDIVSIGWTNDKLIGITRRYKRGSDFYYVQEVRTGRGKLALKTMWKRPGRTTPA